MMKKQKQNCCMCGLLWMVAACLLFILLYSHTLSNLDLVVHHPAAFPFLVASNGSAAMSSSLIKAAAKSGVSFTTATNSTTTATLKLSQKTGSLLCPIHLTKADHVPVNEFFKPSAVPVTKVVTTYLFQQPFNVCSVELDILFLVPSIPLKQINRNTIRETWGSGGWPFTDNKTRMAVIFLAGRAKPWSTVRTLLEKEASERGDLLVVDAKEGYHQLMAKMLAGLHWVSHNCPRVRYVSKVDEDHFVQVDLLYNHVDAWLRQSRYTHNAILGRMICSGTNPVHRNPHSRNFVNRSDYPYVFYPTYVGGGTYVMSRQLVPRLMRLAPYMKSFKVEDAFINGVLTRVMNVTVVNMPQVVVEVSQKNFVSRCLFSLHKASVDAMRSIWKTMRARPQNCARVFTRPFQTCDEKCMPHA